MTKDIRGAIIALGKAMERNDCLDEEQWSMIDGLTGTSEPIPYTESREVNGLIRDMRHLREVNNLLRKQMKEKQAEVMGERRERLRSDNVRNMVLRELYTCQTGIEIPCAPEKIHTRYLVWVTRWIKDHS